MGIAYLSDDVLHNILSRLPPEYLGQLKCVLKSWNALISSQRFVKSHLNHHTSIAQKKPHLLVVSDKRDINFIEFSINKRGDDDTKDFDCEIKRLISIHDLLDERRIKRIVGSCNGLLCLLVSHHKDKCFTCRRDKYCPFVLDDHDGHGESYGFVLCNPSTKSTWDLPRNQHQQVDTYKRLLYGFWYDDVKDDYNVVIVNRVAFDKGIHEFRCVVYSLRSDSWSCTHSYLDFTSFGFEFDVGLGNVVLFNVALYCIIGDKDRKFILAIDLRSYKLQVLPFPEATRKFCSLDLNVLNGNLVVWDNQYTLWVMKDYGSNDSWTRLTLHGKFYHAVKPLALLENDDDNHKRLVISYICKGNASMLKLDELDESEYSYHVSRFQMKAPFSFHGYGVGVIHEFVGSLVQPYPPSVGYEKIDSRMEEKQILNAPEFFSNFHIHVNGVSINSELPQDVRQKYYELCCIEKSFLHERLVPGVSFKLGARMIIKVVNIADSMRSCKFGNTSRYEIEGWGESLRLLEMFGMNVGFLRNIMRRLLKLALDCEEDIEVKKYWEVESKKAEIEKEMEKLEKKMAELKQEDNKYSSNAKSYKKRFQDEIKDLMVCRN